MVWRQGYGLAQVTEMRPPPAGKFQNFPLGTVSRFARLWQNQTTNGFVMIRHRTNSQPGAFSRATLVAALVLLTSLTALSASLPVVKDVEWQPFAAQVRRVIETLDYLGTPFTAL